MKTERLARTRGWCATLLALVWVLCGVAAQAATVELKVATASSVLLAGKKQNTYLKVGLRGVAEDAMKSRPPLNVALVLDKSGSMTGGKIEQAREAARIFVEGLAPDDIISIVTYDDVVNVLVPATKASDRDLIFSAIASIQAGGSTALFAGVSKGAAEVRKFIKDERVNRVVLLSDGLANVGPSSPSELAALGRSFIKEGICVSTIGLGLGYNEDLMSQLAIASDGNHAFVENETDLARIFEGELGTASKVVAQDLVIKITCAKGVRPIRIIGREAGDGTRIDTIEGNTIFLKYNQLYGDSSRGNVIELEVPPGMDGQTMPIASAKVTFTDMERRQKKSITADYHAKFSESEEIVSKSEDKDVMVWVVAEIAAEQGSLAMKLRDEGKIEEARQQYLSNSAYLQEQNSRLQSDYLGKLEDFNKDSTQKLDDKNWQTQRKAGQELKALGYIGK